MKAGIILNYWDSLPALVRMRHESGHQLQEKGLRLKRFKPFSHSFTIFLLHLKNAEKHSKRIV